jgi:atypical dual specificity phosphatase
LNWAEVVSGLVIGTCPMRPGDIATLARGARISALLSLQHDDCLAWWNIDYRTLCGVAHQQGLAMARVPIRDFDVADMRRHLAEAVSQLAGLRAQGHRVYVHCTAGLGRAPLTVLAYLVLVEGRTPEAAIGLIQAARPGAVPAWEAFYGCRDDLVGRHREAIQKRAYQLYRRGVHRNADSDWIQAQAEVLRSVLRP